MRSFSRGRGFLQLDVCPRVGVARREVCWEHILPFRRRDPRPYCVDEGVSEHRNDGIVIQRLPLDLLRETLPFLLVVGGEVLLEFAVEIADTEEVPGLEAAAFEHRVVPIGPGSADTCGIHDNLDAWPFLEAAF